ELVEAAQEGALAAAARANQDDRLAPDLRVVHALQDAGGFEGLNQVLNGDHGVTSFRARRRTVRPGSSRQSRFPPSSGPARCSRRWTSPASRKPWSARPW